MTDAKSTKQKSAGTTGKSDKKAETEAKNTVNEMPADWAQTVLNQLIEAQKTWFENATRQNTLLMETVKQMSEMKQSAPTEALSDWVRQGIEGFIEAQKRWSEIAIQQSEQILQTVRSNTDFSAFGNITAPKNPTQGIESLVNMRAAWLDFVNNQNTRLVETMKDTLKIDESSPVSNIADFAQQAVNNYVEVQKRWLDLATQFPFYGTSNDREK